MSQTKVITGEVRFSYPQVFEPKAMDENSEPKYSVSLLIPKSDTATVKAVQDAIEAATQEGKASKFGGKVPPNLKNPLRDGDIEKPDNPEYQGHYFIGANSKTKPGILVRKDGQNHHLTDQEEFYAGCYGKASINFYPYDVRSKGIACGLNNLLKTRDGERLAGGPSAEEDFGAVSEDLF